MCLMNWKKGIESTKTEKEKIKIIRNIWKEREVSEKENSMGKILNILDQLNRKLETSEEMINKLKELKK